MGRNVRIAILDHDNFSPEFWKAHGVRLLPEGYGEVLWFKDGRLIHFIKRPSGKDKESIMAFSRELLI